MKPSLCLIKLFTLIFCLLQITDSFAEQIFSEVQKEQFIKTYSSKYNIPEDYIDDSLDKAVFQPNSYLFVQPSGNVYTSGGPPSISGLKRYRSRFLTPYLINKGKRFMCAHKDALELAKERYGVPPEVILGIIGVETAYGMNTGHYKVLDALATLAFNAPRRTEFFQDELAQYILLCYDNKFDPTDIIGSIDGGFGISQFMPSSYRSYAVSYTDDAPNLMLPDDAILSVANYIKKHGWKTGQHVYLEGKKNKNTCNKLNCNNRSLSYPLATWQKHGVSLKSGNLDPFTMADLAVFSGSNQVWLLLDNFFVIYSYNHSFRYALTTYQLGRAVVAGGC